MVSGTTPIKSCPLVFSLDIDKFYCNMFLVWFVDVVTSVWIEYPCLRAAFKICLSFDMCWEVILLTPGVLRLTTLWQAVGNDLIFEVEVINPRIIKEILNKRSAR